MLHRIPILNPHWEWMPDERPNLHFTSAGADEMPHDEDTPAQPAQRAAAQSKDCGCGKKVKNGNR